MGRIIRQFLLGAGSIIDLSPRLGATCAGKGLGLDRTSNENLKRDWDRIAGDFHKAYRGAVGTTDTHVQQEQT